MPVCQRLKKIKQPVMGKWTATCSLIWFFIPQGAYLPPEQKALEIAYKEHLQAHYGIVLQTLCLITNLPIQRFGKHADQ